MKRCFFTYLPFLKIEQYHDLKIFVPAVIGIETPDVVVILGNLLDNALEAVAKVEDKRINLYVAYQKGTLVIRIANTFDGVLKRDERLGRLMTLKSGDNHGYGMNNVRKSVDKYNGNIEIKHDDDLFAVEVLLYNRKQKIEQD